MIEKTGLVVKTQSGFYTVQTEDSLVTCQLRGTLKQSSKKTELCVIGDHVTIEMIEDGTGAIKSIAPRERVLSRVEPSSAAGTALPIRTRRYLCSQRLNRRPTCAC